MKNSKQPAIELAKARAAIDAMRSAKTLDEFEESWKVFLGRLERVWTKALSHFSKSRKWAGWQGKFERLRTNRPSSVVSRQRTRRG